MSLDKKNDLRTAMKQKQFKKTPAHAFFGDNQGERNNVTEQLSEVSVKKDTNSNKFWADITNKKLTVEDTHTRGTFLIQNELLERLDNLSKGQKRGFKTKLVNYALKEFLDQAEKEK